MRAGYYTDAYFNHTRATLLRDGRHPRVVMQVFQKNHAYLGGMDEAIAILKLCADDWAALTVNALYDGDVLNPYEPVLTIEGDYTTFAHLETVYLGTLARRTLITTNVVRVLEAANGKPIIFMPARHDHHRVQTGDGYAAYVAGQVVGAPIGVTTDEQASWWGGTGIGTVPHALIAAYGGDTVAAAKHFADWATADMNITVLVDFENDSVRTALDVAHALGPRLWGVRLDTSESLVDRSLWEEMGDFRPTGVNPRLVHNVRDALDDAGFPEVKIVVSGGFTVGQDQGVRGERGAGRRLRCRLVADPRLERLHRRHRRHRRPAVGEGGAPSAAELAAGARHVRRILWDVDTQVDFVRADGKLAVPGAEAALPAMARLVAAARAGRGAARRLGRRPRADRRGDLGRARLLARPTRRTACAGRAAPRRCPRRRSSIRCRSRSTEVADRWLRGASSCS